MLPGKQPYFLHKEEHSMAKRQKYWVYSPCKPKPPPVPESLKSEVTTKANELIETVLKPRYIQPPPENPQFNYMVDIYGKWYRSAFYFCTTYCVPGPDAIVPSFEAKFARMQYAGNQRFQLSFMRCPLPHSSPHEPHAPTAQDRPDESANDGSEVEWDAA